jgi:hypothetical protein
MEEVLQLRSKLAVPADQEVLDASEPTSEEETDESEDEEEGRVDIQDIWSKLESAPDDVFAEFDERLADSESSAEENSDDKEDTHPDLTRTDDEWSGSEDEVPDLGASEDEEDEEEDEEDEEEASDASDTPASSKPKPAGNSSTYFLPSLLSGYVSGSSSDSEEDSKKKKSKKKGPPEKAVRKNRMGQQARRALWEKKFGAGANHLKSQPDKRSEANSIRVGSGRGRGGDARSTLGRQGGGRGEDSNREQKKQDESRKRAQEGPLHPSWEAARKAKERQAAMAKPQGKKITFD